MCIITILVSIIENVEEHASELSCTTCTTCVACVACAIATTVHGITNTERNPTCPGMKLTKIPFSASASDFRSRDDSGKIFEPKSF